MKKLLILLLLVFTLPAVAGLKPYEGQGPTPPLKLVDMQGNTHDLAEYKGKVVLVQFWATYCPPCRKEMPSMNRLIEKMGDTPFVILAVNMGETREEVETFVKEVGPEFPILMDPDGESIGVWQVFAAPSNFVVGADGKIHYTLFGGVEWDDDELVARLKELAQS